MVMRACVTRSPRRTAAAAALFREINYATRPAHPPRVQAAGSKEDTTFSFSALEAERQPWFLTVGGGVTRGEGRDESPYTDQEYTESDPERGAPGIERERVVARQV